MPSINKEQLHLLSKPWLSFGWTELQFSSHRTNTDGSWRWHKPHLVTPCHELVSDCYQFKPPESCCDAGYQWRHSFKRQLRVSKAGERSVWGLSACLAMRALDKEGNGSAGEKLALHWEKTGFIHTLLSQRLCEYPNAKWCPSNTVLPLEVSWMQSSRDATEMLSLARYLQ